MFNEYFFRGKKLFEHPDVAYLVMDILRVSISIPMDCANRGVFPSLGFSCMVSVMSFHVYSPWTIRSSWRPRTNSINDVHGINLSVCLTPWKSHGYDFIRISFDNGATSLSIVYCEYRSTKNELNTTLESSNSRRILRQLDCRGLKAMRVRFQLVVQFNYDQTETVNCRQSKLTNINHSIQFVRGYITVSYRDFSEMMNWRENNNCHSARFVQKRTLRFFLLKLFRLFARDKTSILFCGSLFHLKSAS